MILLLCYEIVKKLYKQKMNNEKRIFKTQYGQLFFIILNSELWMFSKKNQSAKQRFNDWQLEWNAELYNQWNVQILL